jgi:serine/threonine-protein kinase
VAPGVILAHKYRVERVLGQGGMGYVVEAKHIALDERVALKFLLPEYAQHPEAATRFLREARAAVKIKSEHVARVSDVGTLDSGAPYMVMEFLDGSDLARMLKDRGVLSVDDAIDYILQAGEAIAEAHSYGIVHRDIKPANLFLARRPDGTPLVKVLDFGISKMMGSSEGALTRTSTAMGSALYMSPEQMQETRAVDQRTDIYSLGVALFELLAGKQPFYAETLPQLCAEVLTGKPRPLREFRPDLPEDLARRIELAFERDKGRRYQSVAELALALAPYAPARAQGSLERITRLAGVTTPVAGQPAPLPVPQGRSSSPELHPIATNTALGAGPPHSTTLAAPVHAATALLPAQPASRDSSPADLIAAPPLAEVHINAPLAADRVSPVPVLPTPTRRPLLAPIEAETNRIVADSYDGPRSVNAAAAFASAAHKAKLEQQQSASGRALLIMALTLGGLLGIGGGVAVYALRDSAEVHDEPAKPAVTAEETPAKPANPTTPAKPTTPTIAVVPVPDPPPNATAATTPSASAATVPAIATTPPNGGRAPRTAPTPSGSPKPPNGSRPDVFDSR